MHQRLRPFTSGQCEQPSNYCGNYIIYLPEKEETHHLIQMVRKESSSAALDDLARVSSKYCLADALTDELIKALGNVELTRNRCSSSIS